MKTVIANPPWLTGRRIGFRSNVRWPFMISRREYKLQHGAVYHFPLYHAYSAALLRQEGFLVSVIDAAVDCLDGGAFLRRLEEERPDFLILEVSTPSIDGDCATIQAVKAEFPIPIAVIGSHATVYHQELLSSTPAIDMVIRGEFEATILEVVQRLTDRKSLEGVHGVSYRNEAGKIVMNSDRHMIDDLDSLPFPARDLYPWQRYHEPVYEALPWVTMISSRGCPFHCIYCCWPQTMYGHRYRVRDPVHVVAEIEQCRHKLSPVPGEFFFDDDTFTVDKKRVQKICQLLINKPFSLVWSCMGRLDTVDQETLELMAAAGCRRIKFGIETGSRDIMKRIKKRIDLDSVSDTVRIARNAGINVHGTFMIGLPGETRKTIEETINLACSLDLDSAQFSIATPFPGTEFFSMAQQNGWFVTDDWSRFDGATGSVIGYPELPKKEIDAMLSVAWTRLYADKNDLIALSRKAYNKIRDDGLGEAIRVLIHYLSHKR